MNKLLRFSILLSFAIYFGSCLLRAEPSDTELQGVPPPQAPLVMRVAAKASWTVAIKPTDKGPISPGFIPGMPLKYLKQQTWTKSGPYMRCICEWADGTKTEDWVAGRVKLYQDPQLKDIHFLNPQSDMSFHDFGASDFELLDWLGLDDYKGAFTYAGERCYLYETKNLAANSRGAPNKTLREMHAPTTPTKAYISIQTKLPVAVINGDGTYLFQFQDPPTDALVMPEPYASIWKAFNTHP